MLDLASAPMAITEGDSHIVRYVNPAFCSLVGKGKEELIGNAFVDILQEGDGFQSFLDRVHRTDGPVRHMEHDPSERDPANRSYEIWPVLAVDGHSSGLMIQVTETSRFNHKAAAMNEALLIAGIRQHELTEAAETLNTKLQSQVKERIQAEEALVRVEKLAAVGRMAASLAHEINNPLEAVINSIFLVRSLPELSETAKKYLDIADEELRRVTHMTRQTLGFYRESTMPTINSVSALLDSVVDLLQAKIKTTHVQVEKQCDTGLKVTGVFGELRQVVANLLANSLDAVERNGMVKLRASLVPGRGDGQHRVRITVADDGKGIDAVAMKQIFEPFFTTKGAFGTGLGLWVSKQIIDKHHGSIHVRSCTTGAHRGTTFCIVLPRTTDGAESILISSEPRPVAT
jgi:two-component system, NtrC family, sensor kinase